MALPFAFSIKLDKLVGVHEVEKGLLCNCICPSCKMKLQARKGDEREHHFSHHDKAETDCSYSYWVAVRSMATQLLFDSTFININSSTFKDLHKLPFKHSNSIFIYKAIKSLNCFDIVLHTSIGIVCIIYTTPEEGRKSKHSKLQYLKKEYFSKLLVLEISLVEMDPSKYNNAREHLHNIVIKKIFHKSWAISTYSFVQEQEDELIIFKSKSNKIRQHSKISDTSVYNPVHKRTSVQEKSIPGLLNLDDGLNQNDIRTINTMINYSNFNLNRDRTSELTKEQTIIHEGRNLWFISYMNDFYCVAFISNNYYTYQMKDKKDVIFIGKTTILENSNLGIELYINEKNNIF